MSPIGIEIDPSVHFAQLLLCITILIALCKLLLKFFSRQSKKDSIDLILENKSLSGQSPSIITRFFHFLLFLLYPLLIAINIYTEYPLVKLPENNWDKDSYFGWSFPHITYLFFLQIITVCSACLLLIFSRNKKIHTFIQLGLIFLCLWNIIKGGLSYYPTFHWVQLAEQFFILIMLLPIPLLGIFIIKYLPKLNITLNKQI